MTDAQSELAGPQDADKIPATEHEAVTGGKAVAYNGEMRNRNRYDAAVLDIYGTDIVDLEEMSHNVVRYGRKIRVASRQMWMHVGNNDGRSVEYCKAAKEVAAAMGELVTIIDRLLDLDPVPPPVVKAEYAGPINVEAAAASMRNVIAKAEGGK